jgi:HSP20 family molecular chaperone IbpA
VRKEVVMSNTAIEKRENTAGLPERTEQATYFTPLVDIIENNDEFLFQVDLPGVKAGDVDVSYENGVLSIEGKVHPRQNPAQGYVWREYGVGHFYRQFSVGTPVNPDGIKAELKGGVLELHVPKSESAKTRRIEIKTT